MNSLRNRISHFLNFQLAATVAPFTIHNTIQEQGYSRQHISYLGDENDVISAFLLLPDGDGPFPAGLIHHQHHGQRHWGKSEVCGLVGDKWQAFGPALARQGFVVLAPDAICFEDRRRGVEGTDPHEADTAQHYDEMCYRLLRGDTLMRKVLDDSARGISLLQHHPLVDRERLGMLGHSYGGSTTLFHASLDTRIKFACISGAFCSYQHRLAQGTGIEMSQVIPGFVEQFDLPDLLQCLAPRPTLIVSATDDTYSQDAPAGIAQAKAALSRPWTELTHQRYEGGHALTQPRFDSIVAWVVSGA